MTQIRCDQPTTDGNKCATILGDVDPAGVIRFSDAVRNVADKRAREHGKLHASQRRHAFEGRKELRAYSDERSTDQAVLAEYFTRTFDLSTVAHALLVCDCQEAGHGQDLQDNLIGFRTSSIIPHMTKTTVSLDQLERIDPIPVMADFQFDDEADPSNADNWSEDFRRARRIERDRAAASIRALAQDEEMWSKT